MRLYHRRLTIGLHPSFGFAIVVLLGALGGGSLRVLATHAFTLALVALVRELGHAAALAAFGVRPRVVLDWHGGITGLQARALPLGRNLIVLLAGPAAAIGVGLAAGRFPVFSELAIGWGMLSLLPIQPLPGGRALEALLQPSLPKAGPMLSYVLSVPVALTSFVFLYSFRAPAPALLVVGCAVMVSLALFLDQRRSGADQALRERLAAAKEAIGRRAYEEAMTTLDYVSAAARSHAYRIEAQKLRAWAHLVAGDSEKAEATVARLPAGVELDNEFLGALHLARERYHDAIVVLYDALDERPSDWVTANLAAALLAVGGLEEALRLLDEPAAGPQLFHRVMSALFYAGRYPEACALGERSWAQEPRALTAYNLACTRARMNEIDAALSWIGRALDAGWRDLPMLDEDPDLEPLRARAEWPTLRARLTSLGRT